MFGADDLHLHWAPWCGRMLMVPNSSSKSKIGRPVFDKNDSFEQSCNRLSSKGWIGKVKKVWSVYLIYPLHTSDVIIWMLTYYKGDISQLNQQLTATKSLQSPLLNAMKLLTHIFFLVWFKCTCCNINTILITSLCLKIQILSISICNGIVISLCINRIRLTFSWWRTNDWNACILSSSCDCCSKVCLSTEWSIWTTAGGAVTIASTRTAPIHWCPRCHHWP